MKYINRDHYQLSWKETPKFWTLDFVVKEPFHTTAHLPDTVNILKKELPVILQCQCFNDQGLAFEKEVQQTETGHLLEHILLEQLCKDKLSTGASSADFSGRTYWNWVENKKGTFHIKIRRDTSFRSNFSVVLNKSLSLLEHILNSGDKQLAYTYNVN